MLFFFLVKTQVPMKKQTNVEATQAVEEYPGSLDLVLKLDKPEIYLIEDQMNRLTNSLILDVSINKRQS